MLYQLPHGRFDPGATGGAAARFVGGCFRCFMTLRISLGGLLLLAACQSAPSARTVIERAIEEHGGSHLQYARVTFDFRQYSFVVERRQGEYSYQRSYDQDGSRVLEILSNSGLTRRVDGEAVQLSPEEREDLMTPLNSVPYFALLPFNLQDAAVKAAYLGRSTVRGEPYDKIEVTFRQEGGGQDFEDRYVYWFHRDRHTMDYLAYTFHTGDGGTRFREAFNVRTIAGVRFADYHNYVSDSLPSPESAIERYDALFEQGAVRLLSEVLTENVTLTPLNDAE